MLFNKNSIIAWMLPLGSYINALRFSRIFQKELKFEIAFEPMILWYVAPKRIMDWDM